MIERRQREARSGATYFVYRVRWYDEAGTERSRTFPRRRDAEAFEAKVVLAKRRGDLVELDAGKRPLIELVEEWWEVEAGSRLALNTLKTYASIWNNHLEPTLGHAKLRDISPRRIARLRTDLLEAGVGAATVRKALSLLQGILQWAVEEGELQNNPVRVVRKPPAPRQHVVRVLTPADVERLRAHLLGAGRLRDATLVSLLAYAGPRPDEALALPRSALRERTIVVEKQKTARRLRTLRLPGPLRSDLAEWLMSRERVLPDDPMFPTAEGAFFTDADYRNWRRRVFQPAAVAVGLANQREAGNPREPWELTRPYDMRHTCASLMIHEGRSIIEIAEQLGHSPTMTWNVYGHLIEELAGGSTQGSIEDLIREAREPWAAKKKGSPRRY